MLFRYVRWLMMANLKSAKDILTLCTIMSTYKQHILSRMWLFYMESLWDVELEFQFQECFAWSLTKLALAEMCPIVVMSNSSTLVTYTYEILQIFANPEAQIGFHPDAGASFYLSRLPGYLGEYLALTGDKLNGIEMIACGLATHYSLQSRLAWIEDKLGNLVTDDRDAIEMSLAHYGIVDHPDNNSVLHKMELIDNCFNHDTVEEIVDALEKEAASSYSQWSKIALHKIKEASPLSLKVTLQSIREGRFQSLDQCLAREYRMSVAGISKRVSNDLFEGLRARLVDKDFAPKWDPPSLGDVSKDMVDSYFSRVDEFEPELELPTAIREPYI
ncbi:3-hydroxyisobutyryl-CoA hydrolase-like protein 2, mitochondrial [Linum grandiflorum]